MIELENIIFPNEYFLDEVRDGFFISEMMKRFWAAQMVVLSEIDKICRRHSISYFADMGTLIGAVRHEGYIPWDDDLDISMLREDWDRFFEIAKDELPKEYVVLNSKEQADYGLSVGRIANSPSIDWNKEHLERFCGCPYVVGVDIFPIDRIYPDPEKENDRKQRSKDVFTAYGLFAEKDKISNKVKALLEKIEHDNDIKLSRNKELYRELILLYERINSECHDENATEAAFMYPWIMQDRMNCPIEVFKEIKEVPFENTKIRIPVRYHELLTAEYGDYMTKYKGGGAHDYPVYRWQEETIIKHFGKNPYHYCFNRDEFSMVRSTKGLEDMYKEMEELSRTVKEKIVVLASEGKFEEADSLFQQHEGISKLMDDLFGDKLMETVIKDEILFLPCKAKWWDSMKPLYDRYAADENANVHVIPIPYYECDIFGNIGPVHSEAEAFENGLVKAEHLTNFDDYDILRSYPDAIIIQVPYDGWSGVMTVPELLYSKNLLQYAEEVVYIPCFDVDDPESENDKASVALRSLIEQPAVTFSDRVILKSEKLRRLYIDTMVKLSGNKTKTYWEKKMCLLEDYRLGEAR